MANEKFEIEPVDQEQFFVRGADGTFVPSTRGVTPAQIERLFAAMLPAANGKKLCVEYCVQTIKAKKVVRLRMRYASKDFAGGAIKIQDAYFMLNASAPQFGGMGCGTFFSDTLEVNEIEQPPLFLMRLVQQAMMGFCR